MTINLKMPDIRELKPRITVFGVGGAGGNAVNNMITAGLIGCDFVVANTDAQALTLSKAERIIQMGIQVTEGLGAGSQPDVGRAAAEEVIDEIRDHLAGAHMVFVTAGMGGGTGTGAAPVVAQCAKELGILTVGVVTKPFHFEGQRRMRVADQGIIELQKAVDTLLIIPNQNLFRVANEKTTFADAFAMADQVLYSGVACITDLMVKEGLINLDFADVRAVMREMGKAMMGTGEASGDKRALSAAEAAISNPLIEETTMKGAQGPAHLDHRRQGPRALRGRRGGDPHPRGSRQRRQHHRRRDLRRKPRRHRARLGGGDRHRRRPVGAPAEHARAAGRCAGCGRAGAGADARPAGDRGGFAPRRADAEPACQHAAHGGAHRAHRPGASRRRAGAERRAGRRGPVAQPVAEAPAEAPVAIEDVTIRPIAPKPSLFLEPAETVAEAAPAPAEPEKPFIPPQAERPALRAPRMPRIEELPIPAQNQIRARQAEAPPSRLPKQRVSLLQRLASVGLGRREEEEAPAARPAPAAEPSASLRPCRRRRRCRRCSVRPSRGPSRCRNTPSARSPSARPRKASTSTAGRPL